VTSQLPNQTTKIFLSFLTCTCAPPHFEKGSVTCGVPTPLLLALDPCLSVGKFMHSYHNKLLPNHFDHYFIPITSIHSYSSHYQLQRTCFYRGLTLLQENVLLHLLAQKCGLQHQTVLSLVFRLRVPVWRQCANQAYKSKPSNGKTLIAKSCFKNQEN